MICTLCHYTDPCDIDNDGCAQICIREGTPRCNCAEGWELLDDKKHCKGNYILYPIINTWSYSPLCGRENNSQLKLCTTLRPSYTRYFMDADRHTWNLSNVTALMLMLTKCTS